VTNDGRKRQRSLSRSKSCS